MSAHGHHSQTVQGLALSELLSSWQHGGLLKPSHFFASLESSGTFSLACAGFTDFPACRTFLGAFVYFTAVPLTL